MQNHVPSKQYLDKKAKHKKTRLAQEHVTTERNNESTMKNDEEPVYDYTTGLRNVDLSNTLIFLKTIQAQVKENRDLVVL